MKSVHPSVKVGSKRFVVGRSNSAIVNAGNIDNVQLPSVRLIVVLVLLHVCKLLAVGGECRLSRRPLVASLEDVAFRAIEGSSNLGPVKRTDIDVASGIVGLVQVRGFV